MPDARYIAYSVGSFGISHGHEWTLHNDVDRMLISGGRIEVSAVDDQLAKILGLLVMDQHGDIGMQTTAHTNDSAPATIFMRIRSWKLP